MEKGYVYRAYPNAKQRELIKKTFGCKRFVYNYFLRLRIDTYEETKKTLGYNVCNKRMTDLKRELPFLLEPDKCALQNALRDLDKAYENFFGTVNSPRKRKFGYPRFKSKRDNYQSFAQTSQTTISRSRGRISSSRNSAGCGFAEGRTSFQRDVS